MADDTYRLTLSLDTSPQHLRNMAAVRFSELLKSRSKGKLNVVIFHSGQLAKDRDLPKALVWGTVDMGLVPSSSLARYVAEMNLLLSPVFYGLSKEVYYQFLRGETGQQLIAQLEQHLQVKVIGDGLDLGYVHTFTVNQKITTAEDLIGLKVRIPGGEAGIVRWRILGSNPVALPWSDVPLALAQGAIDGIESSYETLRSGKMWQSGIRYCYENRAFFLQYYPLISNRSWQRLPANYQQMIIDTWREVAHGNRSIAAQRQAGAKATLESNGIIVNPLNSKSVSTVRQKLSQHLLENPELLTIEPQLLRRSITEINAIVAAMEHDTNNIETTNDMGSN